MTAERTPKHVPDYPVRPWFRLEGEPPETTLPPAVAEATGRTFQKWSKHT